MVAALLTLAPGTMVAQSAPPDEAWRTFRTEHFRVVFPAGMEELARHSAAVAERTHAALREDLSRAPRGMIDLVVTDHADFSNGFATPFTSNRIVVFARPPVTTSALAFSRDWLELVIAHELVHIFHLDRAGRVGRAFRSVFGRVPMLWPLFPALGTPIWNVEGIATYYESRLTGAGRAQGSYHDMVVRMAALEREIPRLGRVSAPSPVWPGGERSYIYGAALMEWIAGEYGPEAHAELFDATAGAILPPFLFFDRVARGPLGRSFTAVYDDWRIDATAAAHDLRARLEAEGLTATETVVGRGPFAMAPRVSPDGRLLSYAAHDFRSDPATRVIDLATGEDRRIGRRNQFGQLLAGGSWTPDGTAVITAQLEFRGPHRIHSDLWRVGLDGSETRLTRGLRLAQPDVAHDGRRVAAVQNRDGAIRLVEYDLETGALRVLAEAAPGDAFDSPRWAPDGRRVAVTRYVAGRADVVVIDAETGDVTGITADEALAGGAAWSPDGRWLLFWSDRTGVPNLFARPVDGPAGPTGLTGAGLLQVTNLLGGGVGPEVSPDGRTLYFSSYHYDGWHLERIPFDTAAWRPAPPPVLGYHDGLLPPPDHTAPMQTPFGDTAAAGEPGIRRYSPIRTVRPYFWIPVVGGPGIPETGQRLNFLGALSMGWDVVQRHEWSASAAVDPGTGRATGGVGWTWRGLGNPDLTLAADRSWTDIGTLAIEGASAEGVFRREDRAAIQASFLLPQWRRTARVAIGSDVRTQRFEAYSLTADSLAAHGIALRELPTVVSLAVRPSFSNARLHPYSISPQDGLRTAMSVGRWWNIDDGRHSYDELRGFLAGYRGYRLWGFTDHVAAARVAGLRRTGDDALTTSIGGPPGGVPDLVMGLGSAPTLLAVRGFDHGVRRGTRAWTATGEYRFPLHLTGEPGRVLGLSLTSVSGALFADTGNAWCTEEERARALSGCPGDIPDPLLSAGAEVIVTFGIFQSFPIAASFGFAVPLAGPGDRPVFHIGFGPSF